MEVGGVLLQFANVSARPNVAPLCQMGAVGGEVVEWFDIVRSCLLSSFLEEGWSGVFSLLPRRKRSSALNRGSRGE